VCVCVWGRSILGACWVMSGPERWAQRQRDMAHGAALV